MDENLLNLKGLTPGMLLTLGEKKIKTIKDFAELSSDELTGAYDELKGEKIKLDGYLEDFALSKKEADDLIMAARIAAGWFTAEELAASQEVESVEDAKAASEPSSV